MTSNQLKYFEISEGKRHNLMTETQTWRGQVENERHNRETERVNWWNVQEQAGIGWANADSNARNAASNERNSAANAQNAATNAAKQAEEFRHNQAVEDENRRHNLESEAVQEMVGRSTEYKNKSDAAYTNSITNPTVDKIKSETSKNMSQSEQAYSQAQVNWNTADLKEQEAQIKTKENENWVMNNFYRNLGSVTGFGSWIK